MQRSTGTTAPGVRLGPHDHLCRPYLDVEELVGPALEFLAEGLAAGHRILYAGDAPQDELLGHLEPLGDVEQLLAAGVADIVSVGAAYGAGSGAVVDVASQVAYYTDATSAAVEAGFSGLRAVADVTTLVRTPEQRDAFARYEHLMDRSMRTIPFSAMCGYDRGVLGDEAAAELACMHPLVADEVTAFRVFAGEDVDVAIGGEVDTLSADAFARALHRAVPGITGGRLVIDSSELGFIDHHGLASVDRLARSHDAVVVLRGAPSIAARVAGLLDLTAVAIEPRP